MLTTSHPRQPADQSTKLSGRNAPGVTGRVVGDFSIGASMTLDRTAADAIRRLVNAADRMAQFAGNSATAPACIRREYDQARWNVVCALEAAQSEFDAEDEYHERAEAEEIERQAWDYLADRHAEVM